MAMYHNVSFLLRENGKEYNSEMMPMFYEELLLSMAFL